MSNKNSDGNTALQLLKNGASRKHYEGLQNTSRLFALLGSKGLGTGTARNEQLHRELKSWMRNIIISHKDRFLNGLSIFILSKLLTHSAASYYPTLIQTSQSRLLSIIAGKIRQFGFFPQSISNTTNTSSLKSTRNDLQTYSVSNNTDAVINRATKRKLQSDMWKKKQKKPRVSCENKTNIFRRPRINNRKLVHRKKTIKK